MGTKKVPLKGSIRYSFRKFGVPYFGVLITKILPFRVLYWGRLFSETPIYGCRTLPSVETDFRQASVDS